MTMTLNDLTVSPKGLNRETFLEDWQWLLPKEVKPVLITAMGDVFVQDTSGAVHFLDSCAGTTQQVADNGRSFQELLNDVNFVTKHMHPERVAELRAAGLVLAVGQCYSHKQPLVLGGQDVLENYGACDTAVHISMAGQIHKQVKDLPAGTKIGSVRVVAPGKRKPWWKVW